MDYTLREKIKILPFILWVKWLFPHLDCTHRSCGYFLVGIVCGSCGSCLSNRLSYPLDLGMSTGSTIWVQTTYPRKHLIWRLVFSPSQNSGKEKLLRKAWYSSFKSFFGICGILMFFPFWVWDSLSCPLVLARDIFLFWFPWGVFVPPKRPPR